MSSNPIKRRRDSSPRASISAQSPADAQPTPSSLPPSSPPPPFMSDTESDGAVVDELDAIEDIDEGDEAEPEDGEDLFGDDMMDDYMGNAKLDRYDAADIDDDSDIEGLDPEARALAEAKMARRDRREGKGVDGKGRKSRVPAFLQSDDDAGEEDDAFLSRRRRRRQYDEVPENDEDSEGDGEDELPLEQLSDIKSNSLKEWVEVPSVRRTIMRAFKDFLMTYVDENGTSVYGQRIKALGEVNSESLEVSFLHLSDSKAILAYFLANCPAPMLAHFDAVALEAILLYYPEYNRIHTEIHVRITEVPTSFTLRELRQEHLDRLVRVSGVVARRTGVFPQLKYVKFDCGKCGETLGPYYQDASTEIKISYCSNCGGKGPFSVNSEQTVYRNYQKLTLQESPGSVPAGRLPRHREVILLWDLIDLAKPGDEVEITGVYKNNFDTSLNIKNGFPVFATVLEANHINRKEDLFASTKLSEDDEKAIRALSRDDRIGKRIVKSIAPSIYGHEDIKTALALSLFGGVSKNINNKHRIRGDINVLMLGDPGTAKSQFLKYVEKTAHRAVFATGQGASAVGLTASVKKDPVTREWTLEGGALVLADKGTCLIDEFDKMNDKDRTSIHEAMEQQTISISKAGIVTSLQARCAIVAAANPIRGRYNSQLPFSQNVELTEPILSRFDVMCVVRDNCDPIVDELLAKFVVGSHLRSHPNFYAEVDEVNVQTSLDQDIIPQDMLRKYIQYAKEKIRPKLHQMDQDKISKLFAELRRESISTGSFPITVRHLESMIRMAEASAKMHLREYVRSDDIDLAIQVAIQSFVNGQKMSVKKQLERGFRKYLRLVDDNDELIGFLLGQIVKEKIRYHVSKIKGLTGRAVTSDTPDTVSIKVSELEERAKEVEIYDIGPFLKSQLFKTNGYSFKQQANEPVIIKSFATTA
ncbi:minichromosome maintenance protein 2 [Phakopsora pachyrhizi]|uniref:DNA replication licensing factor MCM2 n=1 Tax=Phakopsora pachyrhizi TaxID=170000 RepID=A0AAV0BTN4_PHAPC|nr:minichromosome maintenance protein 2 [Phakopsora pachyrhizi]CAH7690885.1 minichromosome maintenance protein 2 [Phakopsora pachyrhizi]